MEFSSLNAVRTIRSPRTRRGVYADYIGDAALGRGDGLRSVVVRGAPLQGVSMDRVADPGLYCGGGANREAPRRDRCRVAAVPRPDPHRRGCRRVRHPVRREVRVRHRPRIAVRGIPLVRCRPEGDERSDVGVDRLDQASVRRRRRVLPRGSLLRHPEHDLHHQAGAGSAADLVQFDGPAQRQALGGAGVQLHRTRQLRLRRGPRQLPATQPTIRSHRCRCSTYPTPPIRRGTRRAPASSTS